jgi:hypothetical protein
MKGQARSYKPTSANGLKSLSLYSYDALHMLSWRLNCSCLLLMQPSGSHAPH